MFAEFIFRSKSFLVDKLGYSDQAATLLMITEIEPFIEQVFDLEKIDQLAMDKDANDLLQVVRYLNEYPSQKLTDKRQLIVSTLVPQIRSMVLTAIEDFPENKTQLVTEYEVLTKDLIS